MNFIKRQQGSGQTVMMVGDGLNDAGALKQSDVALARKIDWQIARKRGSIKTMAEAAEKLKAAVRAFVKHPFHMVKNLLGHRKVRNRGLAKNGHQRYTLFGLANVVIGGRTVAAA